MNNVALDVAIGLTFTFLLYSLLATTVKEFIATIFSYRALMLERGLQQMLDGDNVDLFIWDRINNSAKKENNTLTDKQIKIDEFFASRFTKHPFYRRSGERSGTKKPSYLPASTFSDILVDMFNPDKKGPVLTKNLKLELDNKLSNQIIKADLHCILDIYLQQANGDVQRFRWLVENWYNETMDRVSGWYKRQANWILFLIGLSLAIGFNVSTIDIVNKLSSDKAARDAMVQTATEYMKTHASVNDTTKYSKQDSVNFIQDAKRRIGDINKIYSEDIAKSNSIIGAGWSDECIEHGFLGWFLLKICGFLITALAISLGAPFWFDLLNKFINLRVAGKKPDDTKTTPTKTNLLNQIPDSSALG